MVETLQIGVGEILIRVLIAGLIGGAIGFERREKQSYSPCELSADKAASTSL